MSSKNGLSQSTSTGTEAAGASAAGASAVGASWSLATRLTLWYTASAFALVALASGILYWALVADLAREDDDELAEKIRILRELVDSRTSLDSVKELVEVGWVSRQHAQIYARVGDGAGGTILETPGMGQLLRSDVFPPAPPDGGFAAGTDVRSSQDKVFRLMSAATGVTPARAAPLVIQVALDRTPEVELIDRYRLILWIVLGTASLACAVLGYQIARHGLRPLQEITATAGRIGASRLGERLSVAGLPRELADLAGTFNGMLERLQESFDRLARFSADIAHELRTPTNNLRGEVEVALAKARSGDEYRDVLGSCLEESVRLSRLIDNLLFLARAEHPATSVEKETLNVCHELTALQEFYAAKFAEADVKLSLQADAALTVRCNRPLLQRMIGNLLDNSLRHTPAGGSVVLAAARQGAWVSIAVADTGAGIDARHLPHLFDRFYRVDTSRATASGGVGLGLAIVKGIAELYGGSVSVHSEVGHGTRVTILLPVHAEANDGEQRR
jgi:two-component system heavy metal sensor histidine kinase CusS